MSESQQEIKPTMEVGAGVHIREAVAEALARAVQGGEVVTFDFNGTLHEVRPSDSYEVAIAHAAERAGYPILSREEEEAAWKVEREEAEARTVAAFTKSGAATEAEMRDAKVPTPRSPEELSAYIAALVDRPHDYGTCVYALSMAATAAFNYVAGKLGVTGFQASCADMDILRRTRGLEWGRLVDYSNLLYPQYCDAEHFPTWRGVILKNKAEFAKRARALLQDEHGPAAGAVRDHWVWLASLAPVEDQ